MSGKRGKHTKRRPAADPAPGREARRAQFTRMRRSVVAIADMTGVGAAQPVEPDPPQFVSPSTSPPARDVLRIAGTGFTVYADGTDAVVLTAYHVVRPWVEEHQLAQDAGQLGALHPLEPLHVLREVSYVPAGPVVGMNYFRAAIIGIQWNEELDVAALLIADPAGRHGARLYPAPISQALPEDGDEVVICGFPLGHHLIFEEGHPSLALPSFSSGIVSAALPYSGARLSERRYFRLNAVVHRGNSGSPVFDLLSGDVVGVVATSLLGTGGPGIEQPLGFAGATYAAVAKRLIDAVLAMAREHRR